MDTDFDTTVPIVKCKGNILVCTVGLPRSGKSTWARKTGLPIVSPDGIRYALTGRRWYGPIEHEVWATARTMVRSLFFGGNKIVVLDSTNFQRHQRDRFISSNDCTWERRFVVFNTSPEICKARAMKTFPELCDVIDFIYQRWSSIDEKREGKIILQMKEN